MKIYYSSKFAKEYKRLPQKVKNQAKKKEKIFRKDPFDKRLKAHKLSGKLRGYYSFSIDFEHRIIFEIVKKISSGFILLERTKFIDNCFILSPGIIFIQRWLFPYQVL